MNSPRRYRILWPIRMIDVPASVENFPWLMASHFPYSLLLSGRILLFVPTHLNLLIDGKIYHLPYSKMERYIVYHTIFSLYVILFNSKSHYSFFILCLRKGVKIYKWLNSDNTIVYYQFISTSLHVFEILIDGTATSSKIGMQANLPVTTHIRNQINPPISQPGRYSVSISFCHSPKYDY